MERAHRNLLSKVAPEPVVDMEKRMKPRDPQLPEGHLIELVYEQLREIAERRLLDEHAGHTLQATALVHEAYMRVASRLDSQPESRTQFVCAAAVAMRRILIDHARKRGRVKRGGGRSRLPLDILDLASQPDSEEILALDEALSRLRVRDALATQIVELRFFAGLSIEETAEAVEVSPRTVKREWQVARAWLHRELTKDSNPGE